MCFFLFVIYGNLASDGILLFKQIIKIPTWDVLTQLFQNKR